MVRLWLVIVVLFGWLGAACAEGLPNAARQWIATDKLAILEAAAVAINWFGEPPGINDCIAARRAGVVGLLLTAELSADGVIWAAEVAQLGPTLSPQTRGRLIAKASTADGNGDVAVDQAEGQAFAVAACA